MTPTGAGAGRVRTETELWVALGLGESFATHHCESCHEDQDHGYLLCEVEFEGCQYEVCCEVQRRFEIGEYETLRQQADGQEDEDDRV